MADLLSSIAKVDADLHDQITATLMPSDTSTEIIFHCVEALHYRFIDDTNNRKYSSHLLQHFISPAFIWQSVDRETVGPSKASFNAFAGLQLELVDICSDIKEAGTSRVRVTCWLTIRTHGSMEKGEMNGALRDYVGKATWIRRRNEGWTWVKFVTMRGLASDLASAY
jgi:hypothetical protein